MKGVPVWRAGFLAHVMVLLMLCYLAPVSEQSLSGSCTGQDRLKMNPWAMAAKSYKAGLKFGQCGGDHRPAVIYIPSRLDMAAMRNAAVVTSQWLKKQLVSPPKNLRVLDTTWSFKQGGREQYLAKHVTGAQFFDHNKCLNLTQYLARNIPEPACFQEHSRSLGVNQDSHLVVYDDGGYMAASRAWWMFRAYGHPNVSVLEGGLERWNHEGGATESGGAKKVEKGDFEVKLQPHLMKTYDQMLKDIHDKSTQILDARKTPDFRGENPEPSIPSVTSLGAANFPLPSNMSRGHMPGSINFLPSLIVDLETGTFYTPEQIEKNFKDHGVDLSKPITTTCYNGYWACVLALGAAVIGRQDVAMYYGSWTEFGQRTSQSDCVVDTGSSRSSG